MELTKAKSMIVVFKKKNVEKLDEEEQKECIVALRRFVRFYEFLLQATCFEDVELHKKYRFASLLLAYINLNLPRQKSQGSWELFSTEKIFTKLSP